MLTAVAPRSVAFALAGACARVVPVRMAADGLQPKLLLTHHGVQQPADGIESGRVDEERGAKGDRQVALRATRATHRPRLSWVRFFAALRASELQRA